MVHPSSEYAPRFQIKFGRRISVSRFKLWRHSHRRWCLWTRHMYVWVNLGERLPKHDGWPE